MKKKKFDKNDKGIFEEKEPLLKPETKATTWGILCFVFAIFFTLAPFSLAGVAGATMYSAFHTLLGYGYFLLPLLLALLGINFMRKLGPDIVKRVAVGSSLFVFSGLGLLSLLPWEQSGGILGYWFSFPIVKLFDTPFTVVFLLALLTISLIVIFDNAPKGEHLAALKNLFSRKKKDDATLAQEAAAVPVSDEVKIANPTPEEKKEPVEEDSAQGREKKSMLDTIRRKKEEEKAPEPKQDVRMIMPLREFYPPPISLLDKDKGRPDVGDVKANSNIIKHTLLNFGIVVEMDEVCIGPSVTRYSLKPAEGIKLAKIVGLQNELSLNLAAHPIRIEAPIPGTSLVGIEVPNSTKTTVGLGTLLSSPEFEESKKPLFISLGKSISGKVHFGNLAKMPHLLVAGATGSGKSVTVHTMIISLLYRNPADNLRFLMIDPKRVELTMYNGIPHLLNPVITDAKKTLAALRWATREMDRRYDILQASECRDIESYHEKIKDEFKKATDAAIALEQERKEKEKVEAAVADDLPIVADEALAQDIAEAEAAAKELPPEVKVPERMPYIVIVIDELADLMQTYPKELESAIVRLAQMSRAVGIHLILSTQRPSVNVITGLIKANVPCRVALQVTSGTDSRTILDTGGAEKLLGAGDMLYLAGDMPKPVRLQSAFVSETEMKKVVKYIVNANRDVPPEYMSMVDVPGRDLMFATMTTEDDDRKGGGNSSTDDNIDGEDPAYEEAVKEVIASGKASTSYLQRKLGLGYGRAAKIIDAMERNGVVGPANGSKAREVLVGKDEVESLRLEMEANKLLEEAPATPAPAVVTEVSRGDKMVL